MRQCVVAAFPGRPKEVVMANKDKGGKTNKKVAVKGLKEKRQDKKAKRNASNKQSKVV